MTIEVELIRFRGYLYFGTGGIHHAEASPPYLTEFRARMIEPVHAGRKPEHLSNEFDPTAQTIHNQVAQADRDTGKRHDGLTTVEREELTRLRRDDWQLKLERDILSKAASWFAPETGTVPDKGSSS
ncbi:transposase [Burkholderia sp. GAS332]|nr:transposase [Burkholderia sp. GAS332]